MRTQLSPAIAVAIVAIVLVIVGGIYWASTRTTPTAGRKPAQAMGSIPEQPVVPTAPGN